MEVTFVVSSSFLLGNLLGDTEEDLQISKPCIGKFVRKDAVCGNIVERVQADVAGSRRLQDMLAAAVAVESLRVLFRHLLAH